MISNKVSRNSVNDLPADETTTATIQVGGAVFTGDLHTFDDIDWIEITGVTGGELLSVLTGVPAGQDPNFYIAPLLFIFAVDSNNVVHNLGYIDEQSSFYLNDFGPGTTYYLQVGDGDTLDNGSYEVSLSISTDDYAPNINTTGVINLNGTTTGVHETELDADWFRLDLEVENSYQITRSGNNRLNFYDANGDSFENYSSNFDPSTGETTYIIEVLAPETIFVRSLFAFGNGFPLPSSYGINTQVLSLSADDHSDNFTPEEATTLPIGQAIQGVIGSAGDDDVFYTEFVNGEIYEFTVEPDVTLTIFDSSATTLSGSADITYETDTDTGNTVVTITPYNPGNYYIRIQNTDGSANFPISYTLTSSSISNPLAALDNSTSTALAPDALIFGQVLEGEGNFGDLPDFDYYDFTVSDGDVVFFDTVNLTGEGYLDYSIVDDEGNVIDPNFSPFIVEPFSGLDLSARVYRFDDGGTYTLVTRSGSLQSQQEIVPFNFQLLATPILDFTVPDAFADRYSPDMALWFPTLDIGATPTVTPIPLEVSLYRLTLPNGDFEENLSHTVSASETMFADDTNLIFSDVEEGVVVNNGTMWANTRLGISGSNIDYFENNGTFIVLGEVSATGMNFSGAASLRNNGEYFVFATEGAADGFQASSSFELFGIGNNYNTGRMIVQSLEGQARAFFITNETNFDNSGEIIVNGFSNALAIIMDGTFTNSGTITSTIGTLIRNSVGVTFADLGLSTVTNTGTISADISLLLNPYANVDNSGTLNGDVIFISDTAVSHLTTDLMNSGVINGDVILEDGLSVYDGTGGQINGVVYLEGANDIGIGGDFRDIIDGGAGADILDGHGGDDILIGATGADNLDGGAGNDRLEGGTQNDNLFGGTGSDILIGGSGNDFIDGWTGFDTALYTGLSSGVTVDLDIAAQQDTGGGGLDTLLRIENLIGSGHDDILSGTSNRNRLEGGSGDDMLYGRGNNDTLIGGNGEDRLVGGTGADRLFGGADDDVMYGNSQRDRLDGGSGDDQLFGGADVDRLLGGSGDDILNGGAGTDFLFGGAGNDSFVFTAISESGVGAYQRDEIRDWNSGDLIDVSGIDANESLAGNQAFILAEDGFTGTAGEIWIQSLTRSGVDVQLVNFDVDGDGQSDMQIWVLASELDAADFVL